MNALLITLGIYAIPVWFTGLLWYAQASTSSILYIILIHKYSKTRERLPLIVVEIINLLLILFCFVTKYLIVNQNFVRANIADIMLTVFLIELLISVGGIALGVSRRNTTLRNTPASNRPSSYRDNLSIVGYSPAIKTKKRMERNLQTEAYL
jgi:hypothetical protein